MVLWATEKISDVFFSWIHERAEDRGNGFIAHDCSHSTAQHSSTSILLLYYDRHQHRHRPRARPSHHTLHLPTPYTLDYADYCVYPPSSNWVYYCFQVLLVPALRRVGRTRSVISVYYTLAYCQYTSTAAGSRRDSAAFLFRPTLPTAQFPHYSVVKASTTVITLLVEAVFVAAIVSRC